MDDRRGKTGEFGDVPADVCARGIKTPALADRVEDAAALSHVQRRLERDWGSRGRRFNPAVPTG